MLYKVISALNLIFGLFLIFLGVAIVGVFFLLFFDWAPLSVLGVIGALGLTFFLSGILIYASGFLLIGGIYVWFGYKGFKKYSKLTYYLFIVMILLIVGSSFRFTAVNRETSKREYIQNQKDSEKSIVKTSIESSDINGFVISYILSSGTDGKYLIQTEFRTDGSDPKLYFFSTERYLKADENSFTESFNYSDVFAKCKTPQAENWICVGLNNSNVSLQNINTIEVLVDATLMSDIEGNNFYSNQENILSPDYKGSVELDTSSTLNNIKLLAQ